MFICSNLTDLPASPRGRMPSTLPLPLPAAATADDTSIAVPLTSKSHRSGRPGMLVGSVPSRPGGRTAGFMQDLNMGSTCMMHRSLHAPLTHASLFTITDRHWRINRGTGDLGDPRRCLARYQITVRLRERAGPPNSLPLSKAPGLEMIARHSTSHRSNRRIGCLSSKPARAPRGTLED